ncbi:substrate-binding domain-containing protein [Sneathiella glossodoripedis]|uniref:substrate-binding domain-containing protein n=1 Tax=Sneathiella glossodoripedis TaxID=418853 RepID=UPI000ADBE362|nr:substrate-binding domain-containing protein [Sneathiella glossodoripedis]
MYNDFVIVGPASDPSRIRDEATAASVFAKIKENKSIFISRGDDSGTHRKEISIWKTANLLPKNFSSKWYKSAGSGMGAALNMASAMEGYVLTDRASWLKFKNKREQELLFAGDPVLYNQYAYLPISVKKHPHVKRDLAQKLETWLAGEKGQGLIRDYKVAGQALFIPNAR